MQTVQMTSEELKLSQHDLVVASSKLLGVFKKDTAIGLLQPPDTVVLSCLFQYGILLFSPLFPVQWRRLCLYGNILD